MTAIPLRRSGVLVCLKPGEALTQDEIEELDEYFLAVQAARAESRDDTASPDNRQGGTRAV